MKFVTRRLFVAGVVAAVLLAPACAKRGMPPGGPEDTTAPYVEAIVPAGGSVDVDPSAAIAITFSEPMKKRTVETAVIVSPPCPWEKRYWKGTTYVLIPRAELKEDATYLVSVSNGVEDAHGVKMGSTFVSGFSTGDSLSSGVISGSVRWKRMDIEGSVVFLFGATDSGVVASFPSAEPMYVTLSGSRGLFEIPFVDTAGRYRVFAIIDDNLNGEYDEGEKLGCYDGIVEFAGTHEVTGVEVTICGETLFGSISGLIDTSSVADTVALAVRAQSIEDSSLVYAAKPEKGGGFRIGCVKPGPYRLSVFWDRNPNLELEQADSILVELPETLHVESCMHPALGTIELGDEN